MSEVNKESFDTTIAIGELGTQFFHFNGISKKYEYALPLIDGGGGEYGGDTETYEAPEMDLPYTPKISGRTTLNDIELTSNYTADRYKKWKEIVKVDEIGNYLEVFSDGSAVAYSGTGGGPTITRGNPRTITETIAPQNVIWIDDVNNVDQETYNELKDMLSLTDTWSSNYKLPFDESTIPNKRLEFFKGTDATA